MTTTEQNNNTIEFLKEWELVQKLEAAPSAEPAGGEAATDAELQHMQEMVSAETQPYDPEVTAGQIRLLADPERMTYVAVMPWGDSPDMWMVIPFSRFENPATDEELLSADAANAPMFQQVYQVWNTRTWHTSIVQRSWVAGEVADADRAALSAVAQFWLLNTEVPADVRARTGAPLVGPDDPRCTYIQESVRLLEQLDAEDLELLFAEEAEAEEVPNA